MLSLRLNSTMFRGCDRADKLISYRNQAHSLSHSLTCSLNQKQMDMILVSCMRLATDTEVHLACCPYSPCKLWETYGFDFHLEFVQSYCKKEFLLLTLRGEGFHIYIFIQECYLLADGRIRKKRFIDNL